MTERWVYGIFNADKEKLLVENLSEDQDEELWSYLWEDPIEYQYDEKLVKERVAQMNAERDIDRYGPVKYQRRKEVYGDWEAVNDND